MAQVSVQKQNTKSWNDYPNPEKHRHVDPRNGTEKADGFIVHAVLCSACSAKCERCQESGKGKRALSQTCSAVCSKLKRSSAVSVRAKTCNICCLSMLCRVIAPPSSCYFWCLFVLCWFVHGTSVSGTLEDFFRPGCII